MVNSHAGLVSTFHTGLSSFEHGRHMMKHSLESEIAPQTKPHGDKVSFQKHLQDNVQHIKIHQQVMLKGV